MERSKVNPKSFASPYPLVLVWRSTLYRSVPYRAVDAYSSKAVQDVRTYVRTCKLGRSRHDDAAVDVLKTDMSAKVYKISTYGRRSSARTKEPWLHVFILVGPVLLLRRRCCFFHLLAKPWFLHWQQHRRGDDRHCLLGQHLPTPRNQICRTTTIKALVVLLLVVVMPLPGQRCLVLLLLLSD